MMQPADDSVVKLTVAWIGVAGSVVAGSLALLSMFLGQRASRKSQRELESLKAELEERKAEKNARRDYEYDARRRLYEQCEPIMFFLYEASIGGLKRIRSLARTARNGDLGPEKKSWLSSEGYYTLSTVYMLMAPLTAFKLIQRRLTLVDLSVDPRIKALYLLSKQIYLSFTGDFKLSRQKPDLDYEPHAEGSKAKRAERPAVYWRQGLTVGRLDCAVSALIVSDAAGASRCMSFGEFEAAYLDTGSDVRMNFRPVLDIFLDFHPRERPVLWRILIAQLHLYRAVIRISENGDRSVDDKSPPVEKTPPGERKEFKLIEGTPPGERKEFDWRQPGSEAGDEEVLAVPFTTAEAYLAAELKGLPPH